MIRLLIVDDQTLIRQGLKALLAAHADLEVLGEAEHGQQAIDLIREWVPDLVLMDVRMPELDGVSATRAIVREFPAVKVLMLSTFDDSDYIKQAMNFGAVGYILKDTDADELIQAIYMAHKGYTLFGPGIFDKMPVGKQLEASEAPPLPSALTELPECLRRLTRRRRQVLCMIISGSTNRQIAEELFISERTVKNHVTGILSQLNMPSRTQAAIFASSYLPLLSDGSDDDCVTS